MRVWCKTKPRGWAGFVLASGVQEMKNSARRIIRMPDEAIFNVRGESAFLGAAWPDTPVVDLAWHSSLRQPRTSAVQARLGGKHGPWPGSRRNMLK